MADSSHGYSDPQRYCLEYHERNSCRVTNCRYVHRQKGTFEIISVRQKDGFILGRTSVPLCRYFLRGYCTHAGNCRFRHEVKSVSKTNNLPNTNNPQLSSTNTPSTSTIVRPENFLTNQSTENENATALSTNYELDAAGASVSEGATCSPLKNTSNLWVNAPEFVPKGNTMLKPTSYAAAVNPTGTSKNSNGSTTLCPYSSKDGFCKFPPGECPYIHGEICDMCDSAALHPADEEQRKKHRQDCIKQHEKNMELSFAIARSKEKTCGVCFEVIMEKANGEQRFGILPNCNHCFCLTCIRKWRQARQFENKIIRACPECRVTSDFVCPSLFWVDTKEDKNKLIEDYKNALSTKDCKYFDKGVGKCPFGNKCFYRHALSDGRVCDVGPPPRQRRSRGGLDNNAIEVLQQVILWDFLDDRDNPWQTLAEDLEDLADFFSDDSDESDWSDFDLFIN